jgi:hypothetical protein
VRPQFKAGQERTTDDPPEHVGSAVGATKDSPGLNHGRPDTSGVSTMSNPAAKRADEALGVSNTSIVSR